jgi:hypothetical protein
LVHVMRRIRRSRRVSRSRRDDEGVVAILVALLSVVLFGFGALVIDIGHAQVVRSQGQNAVDTASLAGVRALASPGGTVDDAVTAVREYVKENMGITDWAGCKDPTPLVLAPDTVDPTDACISTLTSPDPGVTSFQVRVKLPIQHVPASFGGLFGVGSIGISPVAQALSGQPLPPTCGPCDPALDEKTGQPQPQPAPTGYPQRSDLPDPAAVPLADVPDSTDQSGCPPTPGLFSPDNYPDGVTISANFSCTLKPGLYVFVNTNLVVPVTASIGSFLSDGNPGQPVSGTGVTLVFYGTSTLTVQGHIGILVPGGGSDRTPLIASRPSLAPPVGQPLPPDTPIPGVAIVFDQVDPTATAPPRLPFTLGDDFDITGSVYALDGHTTWATASGDCMPVMSSCAIHDEDGAQSVIATTATAFLDPGAAGFGRIPTVSTDHPMAEPPPSAPHLVQ